jgi:hypothetical protein
MYSPNKNIFFIHIPKCAGSSVDYILFKRNGIHLRKTKSIGSQISKKTGLRRKFLYKEVVYNDKYFPVMQHLTVSECIENNIQEFLNANWTFTVVRNPWDRFVSEAFWFSSRTNQRLNLQNIAEKFISKNESHPHFTTCIDFISHQQKIKVDSIYRMEYDLQQLENDLSERFNTKIEIPHINKSKVKDKSYHQLIDKSTYNSLKPIFEKEEDLFHYTF